MSTDTLSKTRPNLQSLFSNDSYPASQVGETTNQRLPYMPRTSLIVVPPGFSSAVVLAVAVLPSREAVTS